MQPGIGRRLFAAFLALWFVMVSTDGLGLHGCPMHDGAMAGMAHEMTGASTGGAVDHSRHAAMHDVAPDAQKGAPPSGHDAHGAHGAHDAAGSAHHAAPQALAGDTGAPDAPHACTCLGQCCATSPVAIASPSEIALTAALTETLQRPGLTQHEYVAAWVSFVLPFATAPPRAVA